MYGTVMWQLRLKPGVLMLTSAIETISSHVISYTELSWIVLAYLYLYHLRSISV